MKFKKEKTQKNGKYLSYFDVYKNESKREQSNLFQKPKEKSSFFDVKPSYEIKRSYCLMIVNFNRFNLSKENDGDLKRLIRKAWQFFLYINPEKIDKDLFEIIRYVRENGVSFKKDLNSGKMEFFILKTPSLVEVREKDFKLREKKKNHLKNLILEALALYNYINQERLDTTIKEICEEVNKKAKTFKKKWDKKLRGP